MRWLDLYHRTSRESAESVLRMGRFYSLENTNEAYFSTRLDGQVVGYGEVAVHVRVPATIAELDDEFPDGEEHYRVNVRRIHREWIVGIEE